MSELNSQKRISINILSAVLQVFVIGLIYFLLYKYLVDKLGVEQLGVWSIILATSSVGNLANLGVTSGLIKFIADYNSKNKVEDIPKLIFTALLTIIFFFSLVIFILFLCAKIFLTYIIEPKYISIAFEILPYSLLCLFINSVGGVFTSTLEGLQKNYIRNFLMIFSSILLLLLSYYLVPLYGLKGVAVAQVFQAFIVLIGSYIMLKQVLYFRIFNKWNWDKFIFKELLNYGLKFQAISMSQMLYEPITKGLISKFGGLTVLGYYEMASRLVNQVRALIVSANQVMIPVVAHTVNINKDAVENLYLKTISITFFVNIILTATLLVFTPLVSIMWIGIYEPTFVFSMIVLSLAMFINILCGPAYFSSLGEGELNIILKSQIIIGFLNLLLGFSLGFIFDGKGVIVSWALSVISGSLYLIYNYQKNKRISTKFIFSKYNVFIFLILAFNSILSFYFFNMIQNYFGNVVKSFLFYFLIFGFLSLFLILKSPILKSVLNKNKS